MKAFCLSDFEAVFPAVAGKGLIKKKPNPNPCSVDAGEGVVLVALLGALDRGRVGGKQAELSIQTIS